MSVARLRMPLIGYEEHAAGYAWRNADGRVHRDHDSPGDIVAEWREPVSRTHMVWMYRLADGQVVFLDHIHPSDHVELLGKKEITITEGEGMN